MDEKDLHKLKRSELLEILLAQSEEIDRLRAEIAEKDEQLADRRIAIERSGSIAEASLRITRIFSEAQLAADTYVANVKSRATGQPVSSFTIGTADSPRTPHPVPAPRTNTASSSMPKSPQLARSASIDDDDDDYIPRGKHAAHAAKRSGR